MAWTAEQKRAVRHALRTARGPGAAAKRAKLPFGRKHTPSPSLICALQENHERPQWAERPQSSGVSGWTRSVARARDSMRALLLTWVLSRLPDTIMKVQGPKAQLGHNTTLLFSRGLLIPSLCRLLGLRPASVNSHMLPKNFELRTLSKHTDVVKSISTWITRLWSYRMFLGHTTALFS